MTRADLVMAFNADIRLVSTPVIPLPAPLLMLGSGLLALGVLRRRRSPRRPDRAA